MEQNKALIWDKLEDLETLANLETLVRIPDKKSKGGPFMDREAWWW